MPRTIGVACPSFPTIGEDRTKNRNDHFPELLCRSVLIDVITPIFGGGVQAGENDPITLVRVPSIRGHLRFWWRATRGIAYATAGELRAREGEIWGTESAASPVIVETAIRDKGREVKADELRDVDIGYALFPFKPNPKEGRPTARIGREGVKFTLTLRYPPNLGGDLIPALWAWLNFGGIGARTRRGLGALQAGPPLPPPVVDREGRWFIQTWRNTWKLPEPELRPWPVLSAPPLISAPLNDARQAWSRALHQLREFRQGYGTGRRGSGNVPGRSYWPEADSLRMLTNRGEYHHMDSLTVDEPGFPRAAMGMPIVMHFKRGDDSPNDCSLDPAEKWLDTSRMSSPVIIRPLAVAGGKYVAMVLRLLTRGPSGVKIAHNRLTSYAGGTTAVERKDFASYDGSPMKGTSGSAVDAFMNFARRNL